MKMHFPAAHTLLMVVLLLSIALSSSAQEDTVTTYDLKAVQVSSFKVAPSVVKSLPMIHGMNIAAGRRNAVVQVADLPFNYAQRNAQQVFAKVPGAMVYDMDGAGNQVNVALRGLDPHRSWELNVRQDGILTNSDMYGYPASHYSVPMEAVERIELLSGTAALGYGAQFGGMINYVTKSADTSRSFSLQNITTAGSYGLLSNYTSAGGKTGKVEYFGYYHRRKVEGYRDMAQSSSEAFLLKAGVNLGARVRLQASFGRSTYLYRMPGPLNDEMFAQNPRQATRSRNWYSPDIYIPSLRLEWELGAQTRLELVSSALFGSRNSVMFIGFANVPDAIDPATGDFKNRQVDIDLFKSFTQELRFKHTYKLLNGLPSTLVAGVQRMNNDLHRRQLGQGTTGIDYDLSTLDEWGRNMHFRTKNTAVFAENLFQIAPRLLLTLGARYEAGVSRRSGFIRYLNPEDLPLDLERNFALLGASAQYQLGTGNRLFGGFSQSYRPVIFADVIPPNALERTDSDMQDAFGYNAEIGWENYAATGLRYSITLFRMAYNNRIGSILTNDGAGNIFLLKTNTGNTLTHGAELYAEYQKPIGANAFWSLFTSTAFIDAYYREGALTLNDQNVDIKGNKLEGVPAWTSRNGLRAGYKKWSLMLQYSFVEGHYADAFNTVQPSPNGARGYVPAYRLWDLNFSFRPSAQVRFHGGISNLADRQYYTKRPVGYPGPGIWPSDGRNFFLTLETNF